jgi:hypothetical protein
MGSIRAVQLHASPVPSSLAGTTLNSAIATMQAQTCRFDLMPGAANHELCHRRTAGQATLLLCDDLTMDSATALMTSHNTAGHPVAMGGHLQPGGNGEAAARAWGGCVARKEQR